MCVFWVYMDDTTGATLDTPLELLECETYNSWGPKKRAAVRFQTALCQLEAGEYGKAHDILQGLVDRVQV